MVLVAFVPITGVSVICSLKGPEPAKTLKITGAEIPQDKAFTASVKVA